MVVLPILAKKAGIDKLFDYSHNVGSAMPMFYNFPLHSGYSGGDLMKKARDIFFCILFRFPSEDIAKRAAAALREMGMEIRRGDAKAGRTTFLGLLDHMPDCTVYEELDYMMRALQGKRVTRLNERIRKIEFSVKTTMGGRRSGEWVDLPGKSIDIDIKATGRRVISTLQLENAQLSNREFDTVLVKYDEGVSRILTSVELYKTFREILQIPGKHASTSATRRSARRGMRIVRENI